MGARNMELEERMEDEGWLTVVEAARRTALNKNTIRRYIENKECEGTKIGRRLFIHKKQLKKRVGPVLSQYLEIPSHELEEG